MSQGGTEAHMELWLGVLMIPALILILTPMWWSSSLGWGKGRKPGEGGPKSGS